MLNDTDKDEVIGGFTVIREKIKKSTENIKELFPYWISNGRTFSNNLSELKPVGQIFGISDTILHRLKELNVDNLFPVQFNVIPYILNSYRISKYRPLGRPRDVCICAPTGSGKTLAYAIPIIQLLLNREHVFIRVLVILPVRDLAVQIFNVLRQLILGTGLKVGLLAGVQSISNEQADIFDCSTGIACPKVDIVVATPGRLVDHLYNSPGFNMDRLRLLVIDEADRVISEEKQDWYHVLEEALYYPTHMFIHGCSSKTQRNKRRRSIPTIEYHYDTSHDITLQKILVSATLTHDPGPLKQFNLYFPTLFTSGNENLKLSPLSSLIKGKMNGQLDGDENGIIHNSDKDDAIGVGRFSTPPGLQEFLVSVPMQHRASYLVHLIRDLNLNRVLCFANARITVDRLHLLLNSFENIGVKRLSAKLPVHKRQRIIKSFSRGECQLLICTDAMARGIDIPDVQCVVSYEMPPSPKIYVHRVGRTARAGKSGVAYTFLNGNQFYHFKNDMKNVGKSKFKECKFHSQQVSQYAKEYQNALASLESTIKCNSLKLDYFKSKKQDSVNSSIGVLSQDSKKNNNEIVIIKKKAKRNTIEKMNDI